MCRYREYSYSYEAKLKLGRQKFIYSLKCDEESKHLSPDYSDSETIGFRHPTPYIVVKE
jgi:hypothetical protein